MIYVSVTKETNFPISIAKTKDSVKKTLLANGIVSDCEVAVALVRRGRMQKYVDKYYSDGTDHPVLSFPSSEIEGRFIFPDDGKMHLGEIIVSYDWCVEEASRVGKLVEQVVLEMAKHGTLHLLGIHHDTIS